MLTKLHIANFKRFEEVEIELGQNVVFVGPNNAGKTSALQALALLDLAMRRWHEKRGDKAPPKRKAGIALNRRDLLAIPVPGANLLWRDLHVRDVSRATGKPQVKNVRIAIGVEGVSDGRPWSCGMELDYGNAESIYCRPHAPWNGDQVNAVHTCALATRIAYLPPMSGLGANEPRLDPGAIQVRIGEGRTAEVLRNLCYALRDNAGNWDRLACLTRDLFRVDLMPPEYVSARGEIEMKFRENEIQLDISSGGRGLQQTVLLIAHMLANPGAVLLLDEPDAHLEILRQRQIYNELTKIARETGSQIIAATHSEVLLNEAADRDVVVAFVGKPHRIDDRGAQVAKALKSIGFEHYYQAQETGWVLYLEGATDLAILKAFAATLSHTATGALDRPYVHYVGNQVSKAEEHYYGLREAVPALKGLVVLDSNGAPRADGDLRVRRWTRREIENYLCFPEALRAYARTLARTQAPGPLFENTELNRYRSTMDAVIAGRVPPAALRDLADPWWLTVKASEEFLDLVFSAFFKALGLDNLMRKSDYHELATLVPPELIDTDVTRMLDEIAEVAAQARPGGGTTESQ